MKKELVPLHASYLCLVGEEEAIKDTRTLIQTKGATKGIPKRWKIGIEISEEKMKKDSRIQESELKTFDDCTS